MISSLLLWVILIGGFYLAYSLGAANASAKRRTEREAAPEVPSARLGEIAGRLAPLMVITGQKAAGDAFQFEGHLKGPSEEIYPRIKEIFAGEPVTPLLLEGDSHDVRVLVLSDERLGQEAGPDRPNWALHLGLFAATFLTTTWAGALHDGVDLLKEPGRFAVGLPYSLGLLLILGAHEMGHYFAARAHGIRVTPPYFIPVPFSLGTFGAFIRIKSLTPNRRALFDVGGGGADRGIGLCHPGAADRFAVVDGAAGGDGAERHDGRERGVVAAAGVAGEAFAGDVAAAGASPGAAIPSPSRGGWGCW